MLNNPAQLQSTKHYQILDGLRGVASLMVVVFHMFECYADGNRFKQIINHGYLAVDFFFLLSGFVVAHAYDDRWNKMTQWDFYKRRIVRLHPMLIMGTVIGAVLFYTQAGSMYPLVEQTGVWKLILVMLLGFTLLPLPQSMDIRGWLEMHPLNGPAWSLFYEYIANILYATVIRKFSQKLLALFVLLCALQLIHYTVMGPQGDVIGGWSLDRPSVKVGLTRMLFPFFAGVLLCRCGKLIRINYAFVICSLLVIAILALPRIGDEAHLWMNGLYESFCIIILFPIIIAIGAGSSIKGKIAGRLCNFSGNISYPLYITHFPLIYTYNAWLHNYNIDFKTGMLVGILLILISVVIAYACLKLYDEPVRIWLRKKLLVKNTH